MRNLEVAIREWRERMAAGGIKAPAVLDELESHLREEIDRQTRSGVDESRAFELAAKKIGDSDLLRAEFAKLRWFRGIPLGKLVGGACCVTAAAYSMVLAPALVTVPELGSGRRLLGVGSFLLTLLFLASLSFSHKYLPVIRNRRVRIASVTACALAGFVWLGVFSNLLPNVIVPRLMGASPMQSTRLTSGGSGARSDLLRRRSEVVRADYRRRVESGDRLSPATNAVFDIGISLFWAMTLAAALGGLAYGLEVAAKRGSTEHAYV